MERSSTIGSLWSPIRIEVGPREAAEASATVARRDTLERIKVSLGMLMAKVEGADEIHRDEPPREEPADDVKPYL